MGARTSAVAVRAIEPSDLEWVQAFCLKYSGALRVVSRGILHQLDELPGFLGSLHGTPAALLTYHITTGGLEVVTLDAAQRDQGLGTSLLEAARDRARELGCRRLWLITTNDNEPAIRFYSRRGMELVAIHRGAIAESRKIKQEIPRFGVEGRPIDDEVEFEWRL